MITCAESTVAEGYLAACVHVACRFWKTGFWKQHLGDKPYHISALYLIDLVRFR